jgi:hypothetical protein
MRSEALIIPVMLLAPYFAHAENIDLVCTDNTGFSINFEIDTSRNLVVANGKPARNVFIDKGAITFAIDLDNQAWFHIINRRTGNMTVQAPNKSILPTYECEKRKPKF